MPPKLHAAIDYHNANRMREDATREVVEYDEEIQGNSRWEEDVMTLEERLNNMHDGISGVIKTIRDSRNTLADDSDISKGIKRELERLRTTIAVNVGGVDIVTKASLQIDLEKQKTQLERQNNELDLCHQAAHDWKTREAELMEREKRLQSQLSSELNRARTPDPAIEKLAALEASIGRLRQDDRARREELKLVNSELAELRDRLNTNPRPKHAPSPAPALSIHKDIQKRRRVNSSSSTINNAQSMPKKQKLQPQITTSKLCNEGLGKGSQEEVVKILLSDVRNGRSRSELPKETVHLLQKHIKLWDIGFARKGMANWVTDLPKPRALPSCLFERMVKVTTNWYLKEGKTYCGWACRKCDKNGRLCVLLEEGMLTVLPRRPWVREKIQREDPAFWYLLEEDEEEE